VAEISCQVRQPALHIKPLLVPTAQTSNHKGVPERMESRLVASLMGSKANPIDDRSKVSPQGSVGQPSAMTRDKECCRVHAVTEEFPVTGIHCELFRRRGVKRNKS